MNDGVNGPLTIAGVKRFQDAHQLTVDGIPGPETQAKLQEIHGC
jgi:peptidoglycan hydrolase-like protein with peptidoglycan-binding domain